MFWDRFFLDFRLILALCAENLPRFVEISPSHGMPTFDCYTSMPFYRWAEIFQGGWGGGGPPQGVSIKSTVIRLTDVQVYETIRAKSFLNPG